MTAYIVRRIGQSVVVLFGVTLIVFLIVHLLPGGPSPSPARGPGATPQQVQYFNAQNGYNLPVSVAVLALHGGLFQGNLGFSYSYNQSVASLLEQDIPKTALSSVSPMLHDVDRRARRYRAGAAVQHQGRPHH